MRLFFSLVFLLIYSSAQAQHADLTEAMSALRTGDFETAEQKLNAIASKEKKNPEWHYTQGRLLFAKQAYQDALSSFEKATDLDKSNPLYHVWVGNSAGSAASSASVIKQPFLARKCKSAYEKAVELQPDNQEALIGLISYHQQAPAIVGGDPKEAERLLLNLEKVAPYQALIQKVNLAFRAKKLEDGVGLLTKGTELYPDSLYFHYRLGTASIDLKNWDKAYSSLDKAYSINKQNWQSSYQMGRLAAVSGDYLNEGVWHLQNILENIPNDMGKPMQSMVFTRYAQILIHQEKRNDARLNLEKALELNPKNEMAEKSLKEL